MSPLRAHFTNRRYLALASGRPDAHIAHPRDMSAVFSIVPLYPSTLPQPRSAFITNPTDGTPVPSAEDIETAQAELRICREMILEKARKAGEDLKVIDASTRRISEKEKGKHKAVEKVKKERACECPLATWHRAMLRSVQTHPYPTSCPHHSHQVGRGFLPSHQPPHNSL